MFLWRNKKDISIFRMKKALEGSDHCVNVQADLNLCWVHMFEGTFSDVEAHLFVFFCFFFLDVFCIKFRYI